jgi:hypothetical protein
MRKTVIHCDNCGEDCTDELFVAKLDDATWDICPRCASGQLVLENPISTWPVWVHRDAVLAYLQQKGLLVKHDETMIKKMRRQVEKMAKELEEIRSFAGTVAAGGDPWAAREAIKDIATASSRVGAHRNGE